MNSRIYLNLSDDIRTLLDEEGSSVQEMLVAANLPADVRFDALPPAHPDERTRDLVPVIMAGSVAAVSLSAAVAILTATIFTALEHRAIRPRYVEYQEEKPVLDAQGNPLLDKEGRVQTIRVPVHTFVEPKHVTEDTFRVGLGLVQGIVVEMGTKPTA